MTPASGDFPMSDPLANWHTEHLYFRRLLGVLRHELDSFHRAERPNYELMLDIVAYLRDFSDSLHHPREDAAFKILGERCPDLKPVLARLEQEHRVIARAGEKLRQHLDASLGDALILRAEVEIAAATYLVYYGNHIAKEEELVLPRAAQELSAEDWAAVEAAAPAQADPLFGERPEARYGELRRQIALAAH
jgi:hemerythrin-like domain-containing protein